MSRLLVVGGEDHHLRIPFLSKLSQAGFQVAAAGTGDARTFERHAIPYFPFAFDRFVDPISDRRTIRSLRQIIVDFRPDIVQSFDTKPNILVPLAAARAGNPKVVRTVNGLGWVFSSRTALALALRPMLLGLFKITAPKTALTIFQNRSDQAFFKRNSLFGRGEHRLIPGSGVDVRQFEDALASGPSSEELRRRFGLGDSEIVITVTRLSRMKGIPTLLEAAALVAKRRPGVRFLLVGPREAEGPLACSQAEIDRHSRYVTAVGRQSDVAALLRLADVFAFPTELREGVPRVLMEAAISGLPIVTTDMPGCSDIVEDGVSGFVVPPRNPRLLADRIVDLLENRRAAATMAKRARAHVEAEFNLDKITSMYAEAYLSVIEASGNGRVSGARGFGYLRVPESQA